MKAAGTGMNAMTNTSTNIHLKPCPFCGGQAYFRTPIRKGPEDVMVVECRQCGAAPYAVFVSIVWDDSTKKAAIAEKWNRRYRPESQITNERRCSMCGASQDLYDEYIKEYIDESAIHYCWQCGTKLY